MVGSVFKDRFRQPAFQFHQPYNQFHQAFKYKHSQVLLLTGSLINRSKIGKHDSRPLFITTIRISYFAPAPLIPQRSFISRYILQYNKVLLFSLRQGFYQVPEMRQKSALSRSAFSRKPVPMFHRGKVWVKLLLNGAAVLVEAQLVVAENFQMTVHTIASLKDIKRSMRDAGTRSSQAITC